jgi:octaprenyl-diphosphate synthase
MIEGELYQLTKNGDTQISQDEHFDIIRRKTAYLFGGCAQIGGLLGEALPEYTRALREYGFNLGVAFQLMDDLLDFTGDAAALGKPVGGDLREGKLTLPVIHLMETGGPAARALVAQIVEERSVTLERWAELCRLLEEHGSLEFATERAMEFGRAARDYLRVFPESRERDALAALAEYVLTRDR